MDKDDEDDDRIAKDEKDRREQEQVGKLAQPCQIFTPPGRFRFQFSQAHG